jgi:hypothetical protein
MAESPTPSRRAKRFLSAEQKYEIWLKILTGELTSREAAAQAGVDRSTLMTLPEAGPSVAACGSDA